MRNSTLKPALGRCGTLLSRWPAVFLAAASLGLLSAGDLQAATTVTTVGGGALKSPYSGDVDGNTFSTALFNAPAGLALDPSGTVLFLADYTNNAIRMITAAGNTASSVTTTFANATNIGATGVSRPVAIAIDSATNIFVLNQGSTGKNGAVLHLGGVAMNMGLVTVYSVLASSLVNATAMTMDGYDNLYITINSNKVIRVTTNGVQTTLGTITQSGTSLQGITMLDNGYLALTDAGNNGIWVMNPITGTSSKLTGFHNAADVLGSSSVAAFKSPRNIAKAGGGILVVADSGNHKVKLVDSTGTVSLLYGVSSNLWMTAKGYYPGWVDGTAGTVQGDVESRLPLGVLVATDGSVYTTEDYYHILRHVTGAGLSAPQVSFPQVFNGPAGIAFDKTDDLLLIANYTDNAIQVLDLTATTNATSTFLTAADGIANPASVLVDTNDNVYVLNQGTTGNGSILQFDIYGNAYGAIITGLAQPTAFTLDGYGNFFITEQGGNIRAFGAGVSNTVATITNANVSLQGIAVFDDGSIAVSDAGNQVIWDINPITKLVTKLTGQLGANGIAVGASNFAKLYKPHQLVRVGGNQIVGADYGNNRLVLIQRSGKVTTNFNYKTSATLWFGNNNDPVTSSSARFVPIGLPYGVAVDGSGNLFDSEVTNSVIRRITGTSLTAPASNPGVPLPVYASPEGIALNEEGSILYVADPTNQTISTLNLSDNQTSVFLDSSSGIYRPVDVALDSSDNVYVLNQGTGNNGSIYKFDVYGNLLGTNAASLAMPTAMKLDYSGNLYVAERDGWVLEFNASGSHTLAHITTNAAVQLAGVALLDNGAVIVSDAGNNVIWQIPAGSTNVSLLTGVIGVSGTNFGSVGYAKLNQPKRLAQAANGLFLIADSGNNRVVVASDSGTVSSALASTNAELWFGLPDDPFAYGSGEFVPMYAPVGLAIGGDKTVYDSESLYRVIRGILNTGISAPTAPPSTPANVVATAGYAEVTLTWTASSTATNYYIKRCNTTNGPFSVVAHTSANSYTDTNVLGGSTYYYVISASNAGGQSANSAMASATALIPLPPTPEIGWFDYEGNDVNGFYTVLHPISLITLNNDTLLAINPMTNGVSTYYIAGLYPLTGTPSATNGTTPPKYEDGLEYAEPLPNFGISNVVIEAVNIDSVGQVSDVATAQFIFKVANPTISGFNGAQFVVSDLTTNSVLYYSTDGSDPDSASTNSVGPVSLTGTNTATFSLVVSSNLLFKVRAYRAGYLPSGIAQQNFSISNFVANTISFGFASGEASSAFVASAGQTFFAPVTLTTLDGAVMYSLQFNATVTNSGPNPGPAVAAGSYGFQSMLVKPDPANPGIYLVIPPYMFIGNDTASLATNQIITYGGNNFVSLVTNNSSLNLLGVGWLERYSKTNLYDTTKQDLIAYSMAHDDLFLKANNKIILGGYSFVVPGTAAQNQTYQIQIGRPSATSDGIGAPGSSVYIAAPTNGATGSGSPMNALKYVTVGQPKYLAGSVYPFRWFNAGDFGSSNLVNADVMQVFQSAIYSLNNPPAGSDFFDAMDSCGSYGAYDGDASDSNYSYYTNANSSFLKPGQTSPLFDGNDTSINQVVFGDGTLDVCDVFVTYRRSLDPSLTWYRRFWANGQLVADLGITNAASSSAVLAARAVKASAVTARAAMVTTNLITPMVTFAAGDVIGSAGATVQVPITATVVGSYPLRLLMLNLSVVSLDNSPALTTAVSFTQTATGLGSPYTTDSDGNGNFAAVWLNYTNGGLMGTVTLGYLNVTIPATATGTVVYAINFDHASASPNGLASFPNAKLTGLLSTAALTNSSYGDSIPDSWRWRWFATTNNVLSESNACPSGDGVPNWEKYVAGVDPNVTNDFPSLNPAAVPAGSSGAIYWPSVYGKQYVILRSASLSGGWSVLATNTGTGGNLEYYDNSAAGVKFYRVLILP